jgi:hypothetical protein
MSAINNYVGTIIEKMPVKSMLLLLDVRKLAVEGDPYGQLKVMFERYGIYFKSSAVVADRDSHGEIQALIDNLGFTRMQIHDDPDAARKSLFGAA